MGEVLPIMGREQRMELWQKNIAEAERIAGEVDRLNLMRKRLNDQRKGIFDDMEANGVSRNAFKEILRQRKLDVEKREAFRKGYAEGEAACGWAQVDAFGYGESANPVADAFAEVEAQEKADAEWLANLEERLREPATA